MSKEGVWMIFHIKQRKVSSQFRDFRIILKRHKIHVVLIFWLPIHV